MRVKFRFFIGSVICFSIYTFAYAEPWYINKETGFLLARNIDGLSGESVELASNRSCGESCGDYILYRGNGCTGSVALPLAMKIDNLPPELSSISLKLEYERTRDQILSSSKAWSKTKLLGETVESIKYKSLAAPIYCFFAEFTHYDGRIRSGVRCLGVVGEYSLSTALTCAKEVIDKPLKTPKFIKVIYEAGAKASYNISSENRKKLD